MAVMMMMVLTITVVVVFSIILECMVVIEVIARGLEGRPNSCEIDDFH
jgi:hypothetical protein